MKRYLLIFNAMKNGKNFFGNWSATANYINLKSIREAEEYIKKEENLDYVAIINWKEIK